ncbi:glycosyltransferase family 4 protein [Roseomonas sp. HF4]|uniref:glycosyltransferase family 4 protein n=1 Tax=Roseomonas sp. HF4 TaxID=2562313 RepID=UPI0010C14CA1|nr:glycosyltransferase family 4 protein [Roseomonas sp. HF4]
MRILLWYWGRKGAGGQITLSLARALAARSDVDVALSVSAQADLIEDFRRLGLPMDAVPTYSSAAGFALGCLRVPWLARRLRRQAQDFGADAIVSVMTHLWTPLVAPGLARAGLAFVPIVHDAEPHPGDPAVLWGPRFRREVGSARCAIALSESVAAAVGARFPRLPVHRLTLGSPLQVAAPDGPRPGARSGEVRFAMLGRLRPYKGLDLLRDAWRLLQPRHPEARLLVAGQGDLERLAPGLSGLPGVEVRSRWLTEEELPQLIAASDAVVLPYTEASQSGVAPVAHAMGVPVVVTPVGGLVEQVRDDIDGLVARHMTPAALADALGAMCDPARRERLAAGALDSGRRLRDWDGIADALVRILASPDGRVPAGIERDRSEKEVPCREGST